MGVSAFFACLYEYYKGDYSLVLLIFSSISIIVSSYLLPRVFFAFFKANTKKQINFTIKLNTLSCYVIYILMFLFSIVFAIKNYLTIDEYLPLYLSFGLVLLSLYYVYAYFVYRKKISFKVYDIKRVNNNAYILKLNNDLYDDLKYCVDDESKYEIGKSYKFKFNKNTKLVINECK
jgi:hypothetical protein